MVRKLKIYSFMVYLASGIYGPYFAAYLYQQQFTGVQIGLLLGTLPLCGIVFQPLWGYLSDILQTRRTLLVIACVGAGVSFIGMGLSESFGLIFMFGVLAVLFRAPIVAITNAITLDYLEKEGRTEEFSLIRLWGSVSFALSSLVLGNFLLDKNLGAFTWILAALFFLQAGLSLTLPKEGKALSFSGIKGIKMVEHNTALILFLLSLVFIGATMNISLNYQTIHLQSLGAESWLIGVTISLQALLEVPVMLAVPALLKRTTMKKLILMGAMILPLRWLLYIFIQDPAWVVPTQVLHGFGVVSFMVVGMAYFDRHINPQWRVTGQGLYNTVMFGIGGGIGQYLAGSIYQHFEIRAVWGLNVIFGLVGLVLLAISLNQFDKADLNEKAPGFSSDLRGLV